MNLHNWYCECRRCKRRSKRERRWLGRQIKNDRKLRNRKLKKRHDELIRKLEETGLQIITL